MQQTIQKFYVLFCSGSDLQNLVSIKERNAIQISLDNIQKKKDRDVDLDRTSFYSPEDQCKKKKKKYISKSKNETNELMVSKGNTL